MKQPTACLKCTLSSAEPELKGDMRLKQGLAASAKDKVYQSVKRFLLRFSIIPVSFIIRNFKFDIKTFLLQWVERIATNGRLPCNHAEELP